MALIMAPGAKVQSINPPFFSLKNYLDHPKQPGHGPFALRRRHLQLLKLPPVHRGLTGPGGGAPRPCSGSVVEFGDDTDALHPRTGPASTWRHGVLYRAFDLIGRPSGHPVHLLRRWPPTAHPLGGGRVNDAPLQGAVDRRGQVHGVPEL
jgi:hypothetical protein